MLSSGNLLEIIDAMESLAKFSTYVTYAVHKKTHEVDGPYQVRFYANYRVPAVWVSDRPPLEVMSECNAQINAVVHGRKQHLRQEIKELLQDLSPRTMEIVSTRAKWLQALELAPVYAMQSGDDLILMLSGEWCMYTEDQAEAEDISHQINRALGPVRETALEVLKQQVLGLLDEVPND